MEEIPLQSAAADLTPARGTCHQYDERVTANTTSATPEKRYVSSPTCLDRFSAPARLSVAAPSCS